MLVLIKMFRCKEGNRQKCKVRDTETNEVYMTNYYKYLWVNQYGALPSGAVIHHKDGNYRNDVLENLEILTASSHNRVHALDRPRPTFSPEARKAISDKMKGKCTRWKNYKEEDRHHTEATRRKMSETRLSKKTKQE